MSFFDSKEEVIDIELTQYGKTLLSRGFFKPVYYSFHDEDVLYDVSYAGISENTNFAEVRIQEQTPIHKPFYSFKESKPYLSNDINQEKFLSQKSNLSINKPLLFPNSLSDSTISNLYIPSWEIYNLSSYFTSSATTFTNANVVSASIPQFEVKIDTLFYKTNQEQIDESNTLQSLFSLEEATFIDDNIYLTVNQPLLLKVIENNVDIDQDIFEFEIYKISLDENNIENYVQLKFKKDFENYDDQLDLYVKASKLLSDVDVDSTYANYYFDILFDKEISDLNVCKYVLKSTKDLDLIFNDPSICDDLRNKLSTNNLYDDLPDFATGKNC